MGASPALVRIDDSLNRKKGCVLDGACGRAFAGGGVSGGRVGQNHIYTRCIYGIFGRAITRYTVMYGVYRQCWTTLCISK